MMRGCFGITRGRRASSCGGSSTLGHCDARSHVCLANAMTVPLPEMSFCLHVNGKPYSLSTAFAECDYLRAEGVT